MSGSPSPPGYKVVHSQYSKRSQVIESIRSPLGFFGLALLIFEAFIVGSMFFLTPEMRIVAFWVGVSLFLLVIGAVFWLVVKHPTNLIFGERSQLEYQAMQMYGHSTTPITNSQLQSLPVIEAPITETQQLTSAESERENEQL